MHAFYSVFLKNNLWKTGIFFQILWISCQSPASLPLDAHVFYMNLDGGLSTLDPAYARDQASDWMTAQLFNGLVALDSTLRVEPAIARSWRISDNGLEYTFRLRKGVLFHPHPAFGEDSTREVVAEDIVYSFTRICDPATASTGQWVFNDKIAGLSEYKAGQAEKISGFHAENDSTFILHLTKPFPPLLGMLAMPYGRIVPREVVEALGEDYRRTPIGTGPFKVFEWRENDYLILHKNPHYFEATPSRPIPYLEAVKVSFISSRLSAFIEFVQGKLDMLNGLDDAYKDEILSPDGTVASEYQSRFQVIRTPQLNTEYLGILVDSTMGNEHPLLKPEVRQALNYAINRPQLVKYLLNGMGYPATSGFMPRGMPGFDANAVRGYTYAPDSARKLLAAAGFPGGEGLPVLELNSTQKYATISEFIQKSFENIGVKVQVQNLQGGALRKEIYNSRIRFWRASWIADYPDGENYLALFYTGNLSPNGPNTTHFRRTAFDNLYEEAIRIPGDSLRHTYYQEMERIMLREAPIIPLYYDRSIRLVQPGVHGMVVNPMNHLVLKFIRKDRVK